MLYDYNADSDSELTIKEGDILTIENEDEGWFFGSNSKGDTGRYGEIKSLHILIIKII